MPLRILKRNSKQYNVVSKSTFVISVELLDNGIMECTLDAESTGRDCLLNVSQRLGLHQPEFFGLRYISRGVPPRQRWVELDRPLRKQLEKNAQDSQLCLGVMFYVSDVNFLKDEMSRYHYFLQLKSDVIDGKLNCSIEQAISLAAYSLQAEFGDFDNERHTVEYLRDFAILPKELTSEQKFPQINVDGLYEAVVRQYASLVGFPPPLAEIYYIMVAQQLDGYGQEAYPAKDDAGNDILICVSAGGLIIRRRDWTHIAAFRWLDIKSLMGHKKLFVVESSQSHRTMQYHFTDPEVAKYVRKICLLQSTFYKEHLHSDQVDGHGPPVQQPALINRNVNVNLNPGGVLFPPNGLGINGENNGMGRGGNGIFSAGITPDLLMSSASTVQLQMGGGNGPVANSTFLSSVNSASSFNHSGLSSLNSSSASVVGYHQSVAYSQPIYPIAPPRYPPQFQQHQQQLYSTEFPHQQIEQISFHHPGELYNQMQMMPTVRTNPLMGMQVNQADGINNEPEYSNGYDRAVSDYTAALQQKYGNLLPDLSGQKSSSQLYFSAADRERMLQNQNIPSQASTNRHEDEPIYQNEIVSQIHSMDLRETPGPTVSTSVAPSGRETISSDTNGNREELQKPTTTTVSRSGSVTVTATSDSALKKSLTEISSVLSNPFDTPSSANGNVSYLLQSQPLTTTHPPQLLDEVPLYVFKPPPPYPGGPGPGMHKTAEAMKISCSSESQEEEHSTAESSVSNSNGSLQYKRTGDFALQDTATTVVSQLSPSANSSIVSAQVHHEPENDDTGSSVDDDGTTEYFPQKEQEKCENSVCSTSESCKVQLETNLDTYEITSKEVSNLDDGQSISSRTSEVAPSETSTDSKQPEIDVTVLSGNISINDIQLDSYERHAGKKPEVKEKSNNNDKQKSQKHNVSSGSSHTSSNKKLNKSSSGTDPAVLMEFHSIPQSRNTRNFATALKKENFKRNRTPEVLPYEDNLVRLNTSRSNPMGYINASPLSIKVGDRHWLYIVAQLPLPGDRSSLWQMVWETEVRVIVSLESDSSALLYPNAKTGPMTFNDFQVAESKGERRLNSSAPTIGREFTVTYLPKKKQRKVWIMPYEDEWREDVPIHTEHFLCFLEEVNSIQRKVSDPTSPLTVICGTGARRSGIFILSDLLLHAADCGHKVQCSALLSELRSQRMSLVSSVSQYDFVLQTLAKYLAQSRLI